MRIDTRSAVSQDHATAVRVPGGDKFCNIVRFYHNLPKQLDTQLNGWVSSHLLRKLIDYLVITGLEEVTEMQKSVESKLLDRCNVLTKDLLCVDRFILHQLRLTATTTTQLAVE